MVPVSWSSRDHRARSGSREDSEWKKCAPPTPGSFRSQRPMSWWSRMVSRPPPALWNASIAAHSASLQPTPPSTPNIHSSSKSPRLSRASTGSRPVASASRLRAVTSASGDPSERRKPRIVSTSIENRPTCQSSAEKGMLVWMRIRMGDMTPLYRPRRARASLGRRDCPPCLGSVRAGTGRFSRIERMPHHDRSALGVVLVLLGGGATLLASCASETAAYHQRRAEDHVYIGPRESFLERAARLLSEKGQAPQLIAPSALQTRWVVVS